MKAVTVTLTTAQAACLLDASDVEYGDPTLTAARRVIKDALRDVQVSEWDDTRNAGDEEALLGGRFK